MSLPVPMLPLVPGVPVPVLGLPVLGLPVLPEPDGSVWPGRCRVLRSRSCPEPRRSCVVVELDEPLPVVV